eukprot:m.42683 g.42683  ORF g.42683 m.42683 type:complete len:430 (+) comp9900_c0_seq2:348-1637(+)
MSDDRPAASLPWSSSPTRRPRSMSIENGLNSIPLTDYDDDELSAFDERAGLLQSNSSPDRRNTSPRHRRPNSVNSLTALEHLSPPSTPVRVNVESHSDSDTNDNANPSGAAGWVANRGRTAGQQQVPRIRCYDYFAVVTIFFVVIFVVTISIIYTDGQRTKNSDSGQPFGAVCQPSVNIGLFFNYTAWRASCVAGRDIEINGANLLALLNSGSEKKLYNTSDSIPVDVYCGYRGYSIWLEDCFSQCRDILNPDVCGEADFFERLPRSPNPTCISTGDGSVESAHEFGGIWCQQPDETRSFNMMTDVDEALLYCKHSRPSPCVGFTTRRQSATLKGNDEFGLPILQNGHLIYAACWGDASYNSTVDIATTTYEVSWVPLSENRSCFPAKEYIEGEYGVGSSCLWRKSGSLVTSNRASVFNSNTSVPVDES